MPYINTIDINGEVYHVANLTDGEHVVDLPQLNNNDIFLVRGDIIDSLTSSVSSKPLSAKQGKILNDVISQLKADVGGKDNARKDITAEWEAWSPESGTEKTVENYAKTLPDGKYYIIHGGTVYMDIFTVYGDLKYRFIRQYDDDACYIELFRGDQLTIYVEDEVSSVMINGNRMLTDYNIPLPTTADVGKMLIASTQNCAVWTAVANAVELTWNQETYPNVLDFLRTIESPGRYTFTDDTGKYFYILTQAYYDGLWTWYGILVFFSGEENNIETTVYTGSDVGVLSKDNYYTPITSGALDYRVPKTTPADAGKVLTVGAGGRPAWTEVTNAEEVAV